MYSTSYVIYLGSVNIGWIVWNPPLHLLMVPEPDRKTAPGQIHPDPQSWILPVLTEAGDILPDALLGAAQLLHLLRQKLLKASPMGLAT